MRAIPQQLAWRQASVDLLPAEAETSGFSKVIPFAVTQSGAMNFRRSTQIPDKGDNGESCLSGTARERSDPFGRELNAIDLAFWSLGWSRGHRPRVSDLDFEHAAADRWNIADSVSEENKSDLTLIPAGF
ncbi:hypothetical protein FTW19_08295 [Terriglobus albidus]|uniref:Uncharacterized protein n=1 Tax=Terriglobus albidus TaxID=1592106 RepID=A0A5B9E8Q4_9BACT|nr:hypothetical protein [Terriglobus albidus]QEE27994.1 hypothetical protein FTW19_08295 [Terriglobus albidus]